MGHTLWARIYRGHPRKAGKKCKRLENNEFQCDVLKEKAILAIPEKQNVDGSASLLISPTGKLKIS